MQPNVDFAAKIRPNLEFRFCDPGDPQRAHLWAITMSVSTVVSEKSHENNKKCKEEEEEEQYFLASL